MGSLHTTSELGCGRQWRQLQYKEVQSAVMGGLKFFDVKLDNQAGVYFGRDVVTGRLSMKLEDVKKARGVHVTIKGDSKVWCAKSHRSSESYVNERVFVLGGKGESKYFFFYLPGLDGTTELEISAGDYEYPFQFQLPDNIPSSFVHRHGKIVYSVTAAVDRPWKFDHETVAFFTVVGVYDLNMDPKALKPQSVSDDKRFCCLFCKSGPVFATVQLDRTGYVPGETIFLQATADNKSNMVMEYTSVTLVQITTFLSSTRTVETKTRDEVLVVGKEKIEPGESDSWHDTALKIPLLPPSDLPQCTNIKIDYVLEFRVLPSACAFDLCVEVPIVIGTIPLQSTFNKFQPTTSAPNYPAPASGEKRVLGPPGPSFSLYPDLPPPTYEAAVGMKAEEENQFVGGNWDFKPQYPSYG